MPVVVTAYKDKSFDFVRSPRRPRRCVAGRSILVPPTVSSTLVPPTATYRA